MCLFKLAIRNLLARKRLSFFVYPWLVISLFFIIYQFTIFWQLLNNENNVTTRPNVLVRGTHELEAGFYTPNEHYMFTCFKSMEVINFTKVNDNYCDCLDETDEPGTNACPNGLFYCAKYTKFHPKRVPSSKVNDGICDCCDGSDEYERNRVLMGQFKRELQWKLNVYHVPCPRIC